MSDMLQGMDGSTSSKRVSSFICMGVAIACIIVECVFRIDLFNYSIAFISASLGFQGVSTVQELGFKNKA